MDANFLVVLRTTLTFAFKLLRNLIIEEMSVTKKQLQLPMNRIKTIMKSSPNVETIGQEALFAVTKSAELFIRFLTEEGLKR